MSKVFFSQDIGKLFDSVIKGINGSVAIKLHFGERGNKTFIDPQIAKIIYNKLIDRNCKPAMVECNVMYRGSRTNAKDHIQTAKEHGFGFGKIDICDADDREWKIDVNLKHFKQIKVGANLRNYSNLIVISHFKGHMGTGFGGTLKNIGMGLGSRAGKLEIHKAFALEINKDVCTACGTCVQNCPADAIKIEDRAAIDQSLCIGCAKCIAVCPQNAVRIPWGSCSSEELQEKIVEYCYGILKKIKGIAYFNVLEKITENCDCMGIKMKPIIGNIGILASTDPVAVEQASIDLLNKKAGRDLFKSINRIDNTWQIKYAEKLGLGTRKYELIEL